MQACVPNSINDLLKQHSLQDIEKMMLGVFDYSCLNDNQIEYILNNIEYIERIIRYGHNDISKKYSYPSIKLDSLFVYLMKNNFELIKKYFAKFKWNSVSSISNNKTTMIKIFQLENDKFEYLVDCLMPIRVGFLHLLKKYNKFHIFDNFILTNCQLQNLLIHNRIDVGKIRLSYYNGDSMESLIDFIHFDSNTSEIFLDYIIYKGDTDNFNLIKNYLKPIKETKLDKLNLFNREFVFQYIFDFYKTYKFNISENVFVNKSILVKIFENDRYRKFSFPDYKIKSEKFLVDFANKKDTIDLLCQYTHVDLDEIAFFNKHYKLGDITDDKFTGICNKVLKNKLFKDAVDFSRLFKDNDKLLTINNLDYIINKFYSFKSDSRNVTRLFHDLVLNKQFDKFSGVELAEIIFLLTKNNFYCIVELLFGTINVTKSDMDKINKKWSFNENHLINMKSQDDTIYLCIMKYFFEQNMITKYDELFIKLLQNDTYNCAKYIVEKHKSKLNNDFIKKFACKEFSVRFEISVNSCQMFCVNYCDDLFLSQKTIKMLKCFE